MKNLRVVHNEQAPLIKWEDVIDSIELEDPSADELGAAYLRQEFPPRNNSPHYAALVVAASGIDYQRKHEVAVDPAQPAILDLEVAEQREEYERIATGLELAARGIHVINGLTA